MVANNAIYHHDLLDTPVIALSHNDVHKGLNITFMNHPTNIYTYDYLLTRMEVDPLLKTIPQRLKEKIHMLIFEIKNGVEQVQQGVKSGSELKIIQHGSGTWRQP